MFGFWLPQVCMGDRFDQEHLGQVHRCRLVFGERVPDRQSELGFKPQKHDVSVGCLSLGCLQSRMWGFAYVGVKTSSSSASAYI